MKNYFTDLPQKFDLIDIDNETKPTTKTAVPISSAPTIPIEAVDITKEAMQCFADYAKCKEHEKTERKRILATLKAIELQINSQKDIFFKTLDKHYDERNKLFTMAENMMKKAQMENDKELLQYFLNFVLNIYNNKELIDSKPILNKLTASNFEDYNSF